MLLFHEFKPKGCKVKTKLLMSVLTVGVLTMTGCGSDDDSSSDEGSSALGTPSPITSKVEAKKAIAASSQANFASNSNRSAQRAAAFIQKSSAKQAAQSSPCDGGGSIDYDMDDTFANGTIIYNNCMEEDFTMNGTITVNNGEWTGTYSFSDKNGDTMTGIMSVANGISYIELTGKISFGPNTMTWDHFKFGKTLKYDYGYYDQNCTQDANGNQTCGQEYYVAGTDPHDETLDGGIKLNATEAEYACMNGTYIYTTEKNMHFLPGKETPDSGKLDINGVKFEFNGDNTATVTYTDGSTDVVDLDAEVTCN